MCSTACSVMSMRATNSSTNLSLSRCTSFRSQSPIPTPSVCAGQRFIKRWPANTGLSSPNPSLRPPPPPPGTINPGFNISMVPYVLEGNQILLRMNINLSSQKGPPRVIESGGARIELPSIALPLNTSNTIKVRAGDTVMLAAQEDIDDRAQRSGVGSSAFFALGGGVQAAQSRTLLVVLITPVLMQDSSHGRA